MNKDYVPYEEALAMEDLGFDEPCYNQYTDGTLDLPCTKYHYPDCVESIPAPLYQQAFRWFRDKYVLYPNIMTSIEFPYLCGYEIWDKNNEQSIDYSDNTDDWNMTYEEAELACLKELIKIVKQK